MDNEGRVGDQRWAKGFDKSWFSNIVSQVDEVLKQRMFPNRSVVVLIGLLPGLVLVVASDRCSTHINNGGQLGVAVNKVMNKKSPYCFNAQF